MNGGQQTEPEAMRWEGVGLGLGIAAGAALAWFVPVLLDASHGWIVGGRIVAWFLFTVSAGATLVELEKASGRVGFSDLGVAAVLVSVGAGLLALGARALAGVLGGICSVVGFGFIVFALAGAGLGVGRIASGRPKKTKTGADPLVTSKPSQSPGFTRGEVLAIMLAAAQVVLGALALFR